MVPLMTIPEEEQGAALRRLSEALDGLRAAQAEVDAATVAARAANVSFNRIGTLAGVSRDKVDAWLRAGQEAIARQEKPAGPPD